MVNISMMNIGVMVWPMALKLCHGVPLFVSKQCDNFMLCNVFCDGHCYVMCSVMNIVVMVWPIAIKLCNGTQFVIYYAPTSFIL